MRRMTLLSAVALLAWAANSANAGPTTTFDFNTLANGDGNMQVNLYMRSLYPGLVGVAGVRVHAGNGFGDDPYLWTRGQGRSPGKIRIWFSTPADSVAFDGYIFDAKPGATFSFKAYGDALGTQLVYSREWSMTKDTPISYSTGTLANLVYCLEFSNVDKRDVGIDNLALRSVHVNPAPGAMLLGCIGVALVGYIRRRQML